MSTLHRSIEPTNTELSAKHPMSTPSPSQKTERFEPRDHVPTAAELTGRVIAITGAGSGIGRAVALA